MSIWSLPILLLLPAAFACAPAAIDDYTCADCNLVLVSLDTLRADRLSLYGHDRQTSPELERLAPEAVIFEQFIQNGGGTLPSHVTMLTSLYPGAHGVSPKTGRILDPERVTLAERLGEAGWDTAAFVDGGWMQGRFGFAQGFDLYDDEGGRFAAILPKAYAWLEEPRRLKAPFFLFLHSYDAHSESSRLPYDCPARHRDRFLSSLDPVDFTGCQKGECASQLLLSINRGVQSGSARLHDRLSEAEIQYISALYDGCVHYADALVGQLARRLEELGLWERTVLVVTSDHGEEFAEHGLMLHAQGGYEEIVRIPLVIKLPRSVGGGRRVGHLAAMVDLMPTLLEILGQPLHDGMQGRSLMPTLTEDRPVRRSVFIQTALRRAGYKYILDGDQLFDLEADPQERHDLSGEQAQLAARMRARVASRMRETQADFERFQRETGAAQQRLELSDEEARELKALGYLD